MRAILAAILLALAGQSAADVIPPPTYPPTSVPATTLYIASYYGMSGNMCPPGSPTQYGPLSEVMTCIGAAYGCTITAGPPAGPYSARGLVCTTGHTSFGRSLAGSQVTAAYPNGGSCPNGGVLSGGQCLQCQDGDSLVGTECVLPCPSGYVAKGKWCDGPKCPSGTVREVSTGTCVVPNCTTESLPWYGAAGYEGCGEYATSPTIVYPHRTTSTGVCQYGYSYETSVQPWCPTGMVMSGKNCVSVTPCPPDGVCTLK